MTLNSMIVIDADSLQAELAKVGVTKAEISRQMGYGDNYLANVLAREKISRAGARLLKEIFGIDPSTYEHKDIQPEKKAEVDAFANCQRVIVTLDIDEIQKAVYSGVYGAIRRLVKEGEL